MNVMELDGFRAKIEYDPELDQFRGEILGLNGSADFYGKSPASLRKEFRESLKQVPLVGVVRYVHDKQRQYQSITYS